MLSVIYRVIIFGAIIGIGFNIKYFLSQKKQLAIDLENPETEITNKKVNRYPASVEAIKNKKINSRLSKNNINLPTDDENQRLLAPDNKDASGLIGNEVGGQLDAPAATGNKRTKNRAPVADSNARKTASAFDKKANQPTRNVSHFGYVGTSNTSPINPNPAKPTVTENGGTPGVVKKYSISQMKLEQGKLILTGSNLTQINSVSLNGHSISTQLTKVSNSESQLVAMAISGIQLGLGKVYNLIISDAHGSATFPIQLDITDGTITADKLAPLTTPQHGYVLKWDDGIGQWVAAPDDNTGGGGGGPGTVTSVNRGTGIAGTGAITSFGTIAVDVGFGNDQIPVIDSSGKLVFDTNVVELDETSSLVFKQNAEEFVFKMVSDTFQLKNVTSGNNIFTIDGDDFRVHANTFLVDSKKVCLADGTNCPAAGGAVTSIIAGSGLSGGTITSTGTIAVDPDGTSIALISSKVAIKDAGVTAAKLHQMGAAANNVLKWNGSAWAPAADSGLTTETDPTVATFAKSTPPVCAADESLSYDALLGLRCLAPTMSSDDVTEGSMNLFFTAARAKSAVVDNAIVDAVTDKAPSQNSVFDALALKENNLGSTSDINVRTLGVGIASPGGTLEIKQTQSASSGIQYNTKLTPVITQTGTAGWTALYVDVTDTGTGTGAKKLIDLLVNGVSKFSIDSTGAVATQTEMAGTKANYTSAAGNQFVVGFDSSNKSTMNVDSIGFSTFTAAGVGAGYNFAGGNVGIGNTSPGYKLDVTGTINTTDLRIGGTSIVAGLWTTSSSDIYRSTGNVGIGTTSPQSKLHLYGSSDPDAELKITDMGPAAIELRSTGAHSQYIDFTPNSTNEAGFGTQDWGGRIHYNSSGTSQDFKFFTNASAIPSLTLNSSMNVGIGTTSPLIGFHVVKDNGNGWAAWFQKSTAGSGVILGTTGAGAGVGTIQGHTPSGAAAENIALNPLGGNVGIGTNLPKNVGHVYGAQVTSGYASAGTNLILESTNGNALFQPKAGSAASFAGVEYLDTAGSAAVFSGFRQSTGEFRFNNVFAGGYLDFMIGSASKMRINNAGDVGIGITTPQNKLQIGLTGTGGISLGTYDSPSTAGVMRFIGVTGTNGTFNGGNIIGGDNGAAGMAIINTVAGLGNSQDVAFYSHLNGTQSSQKMIIKADGKVGIGATSPSSKLEVNDNTNNGIVGYFLQTNTTASNGVIIQTQTNLATDAALSVSSNAGSTPLIMARNNGYVGIGITNPSYKLDVQGGNVNSAGAYTNVSDVRLKQDIQPLNNSLERILELRGVSYFWKDKSFDSSKQVGFIAQEVEKVFPELVKTDKKGFKAMSYSQLVSPIIEAIKSLYAKVLALYESNLVQDKKIAVLEKQIQLSKRSPASIDQKITKLEAENQMMKSYICSKDPKAPFCKK